MARKIATKIKARTDRGEENVFVYTEIKECLPSYCPDLVPVVLEDFVDSRSQARARFSLFVGLCVASFLLAGAETGRSEAGDPLVVDGMGRVRPGSGSAQTIHVLRCLPSQAKCDAGGAFTLESEVALAGSALR